MIPAIVVACLLTNFGAALMIAGSIAVASAVARERSSLLGSVLIACGATIAVAVLLTAIFNN